MGKRKGRSERPSRPVSLRNVPSGAFGGAMRAFVQERGQSLAVVNSLLQGFDISRAQAGRLFSIARQQFQAGGRINDFETTRRPLIKDVPLIPQAFPDRSGQPRFRYVIQGSFTPPGGNPFFRNFVVQSDTPLSAADLTLEAISQQDLPTYSQELLRGGGAFDQWSFDFTVLTGVRRF